MRSVLKHSILAGVAAVALAAGGAHAQDYPAQPITVVVPFAAGGPTDTVARLVAQVMSEDLGQQVLVQNVGGAGGTLGAGQVAAAANDGYTLLLHHIGMSTAPSLYADLPYDAIEDFEPIGLITEVPMTIVARADFEPETLEDLIAYIQENGENITYANAGIGAASQLCGLLIMDALGVQMTEVPYQGTGPAMTDLLGGQIDMMCDQTTNTTTQIQAGEIKAYAVTSPERLDNLPDVPTTAEGGLNLEVGIWHGLYAPAGTDPAIIERLTASLQTALANETVATRFAELGTTPVTEGQATPEALADTLSSQIDLWAEVIAAAGVSAQ
ncbi:tripartite tricarboxylate transporter substrate-binding protein [Pelagibacterium luteolum]|uniref:Tripartite-type tricarboxylate transporter, receptor component TctC n=1 Tax=Pelagibacterium luteolum TaxID=440168 RepID=A0A1G7XFZ5_9HYPH|nr:tripartite tricarboxylate transporter substrate-binding protein [Pelagibacterium luteolum]SDG83142.1 Tripartite-type tricarboxylate transporter, receptor component TctC [Pelagibacterium luteolum]